MLVETLNPARSINQSSTSSSSQKTRVIATRGSKTISTTTFSHFDKTHSISDRQRTDGETDGTAIPISHCIATNADACQSLLAAQADTAFKKIRNLLRLIRLCRRRNRQTLKTNAFTHDKERLDKLLSYIPTWTYCQCQWRHGESRRRLYRWTQAVLASSHRPSQLADARWAHECAVTHNKLVKVLLMPYATILLVQTEGNNHKI